jgi:hypothetical protein
MTLSILLMTAGCSKEADQLKEVKLTPFIYKVKIGRAHV